MIGIIGGTGLSTLLSAAPESTKGYESRYGKPSGPISFYNIVGKPVAFLPRHGHPHALPPHLINYRANLDSLKQAGVRHVVAINAVGGIHSEFKPAGLAVPDQIIDYTYGREHTIFDGQQNALDHIDFSYPYDQALRHKLIEAAQQQGLTVMARGVYAATQGPRLESSAEIQRIRADGGDMVGMTGMPEAGLAREMQLQYACLALSVNWAAGLTDEIITMEEIQRALDQGMSDVLAVVKAFVAKFESD